MRSVMPAGMSSPAVLSAAMLVDFFLRLPQMPTMFKFAMVLLSVEGVAQNNVRGPATSLLPLRRVDRLCGAMAKP